MAHLQYMPGDPHLVDQLVYELKSKGIFDQFRKDCIADVDTRPAYQNLRQRVENSVSSFLSRQSWRPDLNKNQLREKLRKHILDGNYLEQGVERIVDQVVNPKVASVFIPKVEDLVYNYLGITRKKAITAETSNGKIEDLLPTDLEAVSPGSVKSNDDNNDGMEMDNIQEESKMDVDDENLNKNNIQEDTTEEKQEEKTEDIQLPSSESDSSDKCDIPLPAEEIKPENIPPPENSPPKVELEKIELPKDLILSTDIPLPDDICKEEKEQFFKPINTDEDDSSSDSSLRRNMSPLTPIRNFNNENSCDAQQGFENDSSVKEDDKKDVSSFRFAIETKSPDNTTTTKEVVKIEKKDTEVNLSYQFSNQVNINNYNTPLYEDSSNSNNLHIDYESDANSKVNVENKVPEIDQNSEDSKKDRKSDEKRSSHKSSHRSRDSQKHSSSKDKRSDSKHTSSRDSRHDKSKSSKDESKPKSSDKERSRDRSDKKDSRDSSRHRSSHKSSHKDSKSHRSSSSSHRHSSKHSDDKKSSSSSSQKDKDKSDKIMDKPKDSRSSSHRSDKDRKNSSSSSSKSDKHKHKNDNKDKDKKSKKDTDDHYSLSGRNNPNRRSTDRDSNDGSSSSKGSNQPSSSKSSQSKKESKSSSKSESTSSSGDSTSPSDKENIVHDNDKKACEIQNKPIIRVESHLELPVTSPPRLSFVPDVTLKKPKFAANLEEAKRLMKMRKFLDEEQKRMNQEAALLLEFQANVRPSLSQVYSSIPGPELEFACISNTGQHQEIVVQSNDNHSHQEYIQKPHYTNNQLLNVLNDATIEVEKNNPRTDEIIENDTDSTLHPVEKVNDEIVEDHTHRDNNEVSGLEFKEIDTDELKQIITKTRAMVSTQDEQNENKTEFEITVIAEELSENEESFSNETSVADKNGDTLMNETSVIDKNEEVIPNESCGKSINKHEKKPEARIVESHINGEIKLRYFAEHEKYSAEIERAKFSNFFKKYSAASNKIYLINCDTYEENLIRDESKKFGEFDIVSYQKNGHLKLPKTKNVIKNVNISTEISLPYNEYDEKSMFSPDKSECSFELSDYDAKLEEMVNKTSRQQIMEIILGNVSESPSKMPKIDYITDSKIDNDYDHNLKRKIDDSVVNNNRPVLTANKIRKLSTEQITSTTQENEEMPTNKLTNNIRSKYLGKARRVGLPRPKRTILPNSPSSDKSVENYEQNATPNGKVRRSKVQRYDTSDLYKPKLHFLSRRNQIT